jgi:hypothetical protein
MKTITDRLITGMVSCVSAAMLGSSATANFQYITNYATWQGLVPTQTTIDLTELNEGDWLTDQYAHLGVLFDGGAIQETFNNYPLDGHGVYGGCTITVTLASEAYAIGSHHPGAMRFDLYSGNTLLYTSLATGSGANNFRGVVSSTPFDRVVMRGVTLGPPSCDPIAVDNFYFASVPGPGALPLLALGCLGRGRRRHERRA